MCIFVGAQQLSIIIVLLIQTRDLYVLKLISAVLTLHRSPSQNFLSLLIYTHMCVVHFVFSTSILVPLTLFSATEQTFVNTAATAETAATVALITAPALKSLIFS